MRTHKYMKYKPRWNSIPTYEEFDFDASLNYKPLEYYTSLSTDEYNKLGTELKANIEFTKWAYRCEVFGLYEWGYMKHKLTISDKIYNFFHGQVFWWIIVPVIGWIVLGGLFCWILELLGF